MDFNQVLHTRRSVKSFIGQEIDESKLNNILNAVSTAPSWRNQQCWKIIIVRSKSIKNDVANALAPDNTAREGLRQAPLIAVICAEPQQSNIVGEKHYYLVDSAIAMDHFILAASNEGLGTCWVADFDEEPIREALQIPDQYRVVALTPVGYPDQIPDYENKRPLHEIAYIEQWGNYLN